MNILRQSRAGAAMALATAALAFSALDRRAFIANAVRRQASANPTLTNFATGLSQDLSSALAEFLAPTVEVPSTIGQYKRFDEKNAFQVYNTARAVGGRATRIEFETTDGTYNCQPQSLEVPIDDSEKDAADSEDPILLQQSKVRTLISSTTLSHEARSSTKLSTR